MDIEYNEKTYTPGLTLTISLQAKYQRMLKKKVKSASLTIKTKKSCATILKIVKKSLKKEGIEC